jgi:hypothetical protein
LGDVVLYLSASFLNRDGCGSGRLDLLIQDEIRCNEHVGTIFIRLSCESCPSALIDRSTWSGTKPGPRTHPWPQPPWPASRAHNQESTPSSHSSLTFQAIAVPGPPNRVYNMHLARARPHHSSPAQTSAGWIGLFPGRNLGPSCGFGRVHGCGKSGYVPALALGGSHSRLQW